MTKLTGTLLLAVAALLGAEALVRRLGLIDFPIYRTAKGVGYHLAPSQHGSFLRKNTWYVNDAGFNNPEPFRGSDSNCILIGDSVAYGGNPVGYPDRIGTVASGKLGRQVWVAATGGWNLLNELAFMEMHRAELRQAAHLVLLLNEGDFGSASAWTGDLAFPTYRPRVATLYLARRYVLPHASELPPIIQGASEADEQAWQRGLTRVLSWYPHAATVILFPGKKILRDDVNWMRSTSKIRAFASHHSDRMKIIDVRPMWTERLYRDNYHPTVEGNNLLGRAVAGACANL